jgi:hypothetical protein
VVITEQPDALSKFLDAANTVVNKGATGKRIRQAMHQEAGVEAVKAVREGRGPEGLDPFVGRAHYDAVMGKKIGLDAMEDFQALVAENANNPDFQVEEEARQFATDLLTSNDSPDQVANIAAQLQAKLDGIVNKETSRRATAARLAIYDMERNNNERENSAALMAADLAPDEEGYTQAMAAWAQQREDQFQENKKSEFFDAAKYRTQTATGLMADGVLLGNPEMVKDAAMMPNAAGANLWNDPVEGPRLKGWYMRATTTKTKGITLRQKQDDERLIDAAKQRGSTFTFEQLDAAIGTEGGPSTVSAANTILETQLEAKLGFQQLDSDVTLIAGGNIMDIPPGPERQNRVNLATADLYENLMADPNATAGQALGAVQLAAAFDGTTVDWISTRANAMVESGTAADMEDAVIYKKTMAIKPGLYSSTLSHVNLAAITHYEYLVGQFGDDQNGHKKAAATLQNFKPDAREARKALQKDANWREVHEPAILRDHSFMDLEEIKDRAAFHHAGGLDVATSVSLAVGSMEKEQSVDEHGIVMRKATYITGWEDAAVRQRVRETFLTSTGPSRP